MRTLSARTFEALLDDSNLRENEVRDEIHAWIIPKRKHASTHPRSAPLPKRSRHNDGGRHPPTKKLLFPRLVSSAMGHVTEIFLRLSLPSFFRCIQQEWTALQNLPSLPRDLSAVDLVQDEEDEASALDTMRHVEPPPVPPPVAPAAAAEEMNNDADDEMEYGAGAAGGAAELELATQTQRLTPPSDDGDDDAEEEEDAEYTAMADDDDLAQAAKAKATAARAKAEEARRYATQKTAAATVGLYKLNAVAPYLESAWFAPTLEPVET